ncbi:hypothetical protein [Bacillus sp. 1P06AnD]|uniref:hypothetical protein n=1 Tax=Bacillus sp. 1P06AnD TaxID=3132208 RepID=UPI0039A3E3F8
MNNEVFAIAVYPINNTYVVRSCCSRGYTLHATEGGFHRFPGCTCKDLATGLTKEEAIDLGQKYSKEINVPFILE